MDRQNYYKLCGRPPQYAPRPLQVDLLTLKMVSESRVTWATSVPTLVFLGLSVLNLGPMYTTDVRQTDVMQTSDAHYRLMPPRRERNNNQDDTYSAVIMTEVITSSSGECRAPYLA